MAFYRSAENGTGVEPIKFRIVKTFKSIRLKIKVRRVLDVNFGQ